MGGGGVRPIVCEDFFKKVKNPKGFSMFLKNLICCERCVHFHMSSIDLQIPRFKCGITVFLRGTEKSVFLLPGLSYKQSILGPSLILCYCHAVNLSPIFFVTLPGEKGFASEGKGRGREAKLPPGTSPGAVPGASYHLQALSLYTSTRGKGWPPSAARNIWLASAFGHLAPPLSALDVTRHLVR